MLDVGDIIIITGEGRGGFLIKSFSPPPSVIESVCHRSNAVYCQYDKTMSCQGNYYQIIVLMDSKGNKITAPKDKGYTLTT